MNAGDRLLEDVWALGGGPDIEVTRVQFKNLASQPRVNFANE